MSTLPRKKSRSITVSGRVFRWVIKGEARFHGNTWSKPLLTVQAKGKAPGRVMQCQMVCAATGGLEPDLDIGEPLNTAVVLPSDVRKAIEVALKAGWNPEERGGAYRLPDREFGLEEFFRLSDPVFVGKLPDRTDILARRSDGS